MLTEFAFTPGVFERESYESDKVWSDTLRALAAEMFPRTGPSPVVASDLFSGSLLPEIRKQVRRIENDNVRFLADGLLTKIQQVAVQRPGMRNWPESDLDWFQESLASHRDEPIGRIVSTRSTIESGEISDPSVYPVEDTNEDKFWNGIGMSSSPHLIADEQMNLLRTMLLHADWIAIINPYSVDNERAFVRAIYANATTRKPGYDVPDFEIHGQLDGRFEASSQQSNAEDLKKSLAIIHSIESNISIFFWPKFLDRYVVAGTYTSTSSEVKRKKIRWGVSMSHVARDNDQPDVRTSWHLMQKDGLRHVESKFLSAESRESIQSIEIGSSDGSVRRAQRKVF
ncbi:hypothetical protein [Allorhodopirellula solitaria]|uniref:Uncharacterized protein n=1 Tax=Allorhodopirellula solitaria TaxID=2527987 RepID=A0A5C5YFW9_9BACT|nr:hypothetical protein [Allorhodopirellula solitaria]TWT73994.1 hypothetical protein CA85_08770 [Allorhodopirellula solitaria]